MMDDVQSSLFAPCADVLAASHERRDDLSALLDPNLGFAPRLSRICKKKLEEMDPVRSSPEVIELLKLESNTWDLIQTLMSSRKTETPPNTPTATELLLNNPYTPTATLAHAILLSNPLLAELVAVREWLHDSAPAPASLSSPQACAALEGAGASGYWKFTRLKLAHAKRTTGAGAKDKEVDVLVKEMDPDAVNRLDEKENGGRQRILAVEDANYEKALAQALYGYIRAGRLDDAIDMCRRARRPWRAASIRGSLLFQWRALIDETASNIELDGADMTVVADGWTGNKRRRLWKQTCARAALNTLLPEQDRILYAALAPSAATSIVLKNACRTWHDHLWVQVSIIVEGKQVDALSRAGFIEAPRVTSASLGLGAGDSAGGGYWEGGMEAVERIARQKEVMGWIGRRGERKVFERESREWEEREWEGEAVRTLEQLAGIAVVEGPPAFNPFHVSQLHIILNRMDKLLSDFAEGLKTNEFRSEQSNFPTLIRFFTHLCLFLQMIDVHVPADATQVILELYLQVLEESNQREHIALYASALGDTAVERYAQHLASLELMLHANLNERRQALLRAEKHGLDVVKVARVTAERTIEKGLAALPRMKITLPRIVLSLRHGMDRAAATPKLTEIEWYLVRSIEWTTFMEQTYHDAVEQANVILRYFIGIGKVYAAQTLLSLLPTQLRTLSFQSSLESDVDKTQSAEYIAYLQFFAVWESFEKLAVLMERQRQKEKERERDKERGGREKEREKIGVSEEIKALLEETREKVIELLTTDWLVGENDGDNPEMLRHDKRYMTLLRIRRIYIPEFVIQLHELLIATSHAVSKNLRHTLGLVNIVADERYRLYEDFLGEREFEDDGEGEGGGNGEIGAIEIGMEVEGGDEAHVEEELAESAAAAAAAAAEQGQLKTEQATAAITAKAMLEDLQMRQRQSRLDDYLVAVSRALMQGLENGGSDPFAVLH